MKFFFDFNYKRKFFGAVGFYFFYVILFFVGAMVIVGQLSKGKTVEEAQAFGTTVGRWVALGLPTLFALIIYLAKKNYKNVAIIISGVLAIVFAAFGGLIFGFIPLAFMTTREPGNAKGKSKKKKK